MKIIFNRTSNDQLITESGERSVEDVEVKPENFDHELVGWEIQNSEYDYATDVLKIFVWDMSDPETYL